MTTATHPTTPYGRSYGGSATENYEKFFIPVIGGPLARDLVAEAGLSAGERVIDVACGTGIIARLAAERVGAAGRVDAVDINAGMLAVARSIARPAEPPIRWYETPAESIPLPDDSYDVAFCQLGLQFMEDRLAALREIRRVLVPSGRAFVSVPTPTPFWDVVDEALSKHLPAGAAFVRMVFCLNDPAEIERLFRNAGFREVTARSFTKVIRPPSPREFLWQYVQSTPLTGLAEAADEKTLAAVEREVVAGWQPWVRHDGMEYEQAMIVASARK